MVKIPVRRGTEEHCIPIDEKVPSGEFILSIVLIDHQCGEHAMSAPEIRVDESLVGRQVITVDVLEFHFKGVLLHFEKLLQLLHFASVDELVDEAFFRNARVSLRLRIDDVQFLVQGRLNFGRHEKCSDEHVFFFERKSAFVGVDEVIPKSFSHSHKVPDTRKAF
ncbi:MAG: hypothetical protein WA194_00380 [Patescibacteria group bacterium]